jgi:hypothetical protein
MGETHREYSDLIEAIHGYVDDIIFFSSRLATDLIEHGTRIRMTFSRRGRRTAPNVNTVDFSQARAGGLIPPDEQYRDWLDGFVRRNITADAERTAP